MFQRPGKSGNKTDFVPFSIHAFGSQLTVSEFDERTQADMNAVLNELCRRLPNGGDHESRKFVAEQLMQAARTGVSTRSDLRDHGRRAVALLQNGPKLVS
jgi:hypothetical protein